jgi:hypothetical protein
MSNLPDPRMSNLCGNARKTRLTRPMAYSPPKADMCGALANVCFGPETDIMLIAATPPQSIRDGNGSIGEAGATREN